MSEIRVDNITDEEGTGSPNIIYDNAASGLTATSVQGVIDEVAQFESLYFGISGGNILNDLEVPETKLTIQPGACMADVFPFQIVWENPITFDALATGVNGLESGFTRPESGTIHIYAIADSNGVNPVGVLGSNSPTSPALPDGYDRKRRVASVVTFNSEFKTIKSIGNFFQYDNGARQVDTTGTQQDITFTLGEIPVGVPIIAQVNHGARAATGSSSRTTGVSVLFYAGNEFSRISVASLANPDIVGAEYESNINFVQMNENDREVRLLVNQMEGQGFSFRCSCRVAGWVDKRARLTS